MSNKQHYEKACKRLSTAVQSGTHLWVSSIEDWDVASNEDVERVRRFADRGQQPPRNGLVTPGTEGGRP